jgi:hypothetical protein
LLNRLGLAKLALALRGGLGQGDLGGLRGGEAFGLEAFEVVAFEVVKGAVVGIDAALEEGEVFAAAMKLRPSRRGLPAR